MSNPFPTCRALIFDLMGTCCDWHTSILSVLSNLPLPKSIPKSSLSDLALEWRAAFFSEIHDRFEQALPQEDIDKTHRRTLDTILARRGVTLTEWNGEIRDRLVSAWHNLTAWPDVLPALQKLRGKYFVVVLANGTTRLQLDIIQSTNLPFHTLFSSQLLGLTKPDPQIYVKAAALMGLDVGECIMVAAHAYDTKAAKEVGMRTIYVRRWSEDPGEDFDAVEHDVDLFVDGRDGSLECGLGSLLRRLGV